MTLGTDWTAPLEGDDLATILRAMDKPVLPGDETRKTNLRLTSAPLQPYDYDRMRYIEVGPVQAVRTQEMLQDAVVEAICALYRAVEFADALAPCIEQSRAREALLALGVSWQPRARPAVGAPQ
jgi:hypothetical protein